MVIDRVFAGLVGYPSPEIVIPAKAGIHLSVPERAEEWIPAFGGMTYYEAKAKQNLMHDPDVAVQQGLD